MTPENIINAIVANPNLKTLASVGADNAIATYLSENASKVPKTGTWVTELGILKILGTQNGAIFCSIIHSIAAMNPAIEIIDRRLRGEVGVDIGDPDTQQGMLALPAQLVGTAFPQENIPVLEQLINSLVDYASFKEIVKPEDVSYAMAQYRTDGQVGGLPPDPPPA